MSTICASSFLKQHHDSIRRMTYTICQDYGFKDSPEDIIQDIAVKVLTGCMKSFNPDQNVRPTTFLYSIIRNHILIVMNSKEYRISKNKPFELVSPWEFNSQHDFDIDRAINEEKVHVRIIERLQRNAFDDDVNKKIERDDFQDKKLKNKDDRILKVFQYLYEGYSAGQIAEKLSLSTMSIINLKTKLAALLMEYNRYL